MLAVDDRIQDCIGKGFSCDPAALWQELLSPVLEQARSSRHPVTVDAAQRARWPWPVAAGLAVAVDAEQVAVLMVGSPLDRKSVV